MRPSFDGTDRIARLLAAFLLLVGVVSLTAAWALHERDAAHRFTLTAGLPDAPEIPASMPSGAAAPATTPIVPTHLFIPRINVNTTVGAKATQHTRDPFLHRDVATFGVPDDMYSTTWWSSGPQPGSTGMAVVLGHTQVGGYGVFNRLGSLHPGDVVDLTSAGRTLRFAVISVRAGIPKTQAGALQRTLQRHPPAAGLALLTCSGLFDQQLSQSIENTVAFAELIG